MNCLLVLTRNIDEDMRYTIPLGICYISAAAKTVRGVTVHTLNLNKFPVEEQEGILRRFIVDNSIEVVMTGGIFTLFPGIFEAVKTAKEIDSNIITIVGGGIISGDPEAGMEALEHADIGVIGEGEQTVVELLNTVLAGAPLDSVDGLVFKKGEGLVFTASRKEMKDLRQLPRCDYEAFDLEHYLNQDCYAQTRVATSRWLSNPSLYVATSRSCPHSCTFCFHSGGKNYRVRDLDDFEDELNSLVRRYSPQSITLADELLGVQHDRMARICGIMQDVGVPWTTNFRVNDVTPELIRLLRSSNCQGVSYGLESASNVILKSMRKNTTVAQMEYALRISREEGLPAQGGGF